MSDETPHPTQCHVATGARCYYLFAGLYRCVYPDRHSGPHLARDPYGREYSTACGARFERSSERETYVCSLERGHAGNHEAWGAGVLCWRWASEGGEARSQSHAASASATPPSSASNRCTCPPFSAFHAPECPEYDPPAPSSPSEAPSGERLSDALGGKLDRLIREARWLADTGNAEMETTVDALLADVLAEVTRLRERAALGDALLAALAECPPDHPLWRPTLELTPEGAVQYWTPEGGHDTDATRALADRLRAAQEGRT